MINCRQIIDAAYARSTFNDPGTSGTDKELIGVIDRFMRRLYAEVARLDPTFFGDQKAVTGVAGKWTWPPDAEVIYHVENSAGEEVSMMKFKQREDEVAPRVYRWGQQFLTVGLTGDPSPTETLTFYYSKKHPPLNNDLAATAPANQLDPSFPEQMFDLPVVEVARYLATKETRGAEVQMFEAEKQELMEVLRLHVENQNAGVKTRFGARPQLPSNRAKLME